MAEKISPMLDPLTPPTPEKKKKKKDKKRKDKERNRRSVSGTPPIPSGNHHGDEETGKQTDDEMLSESELKSRREALLAQLNMSMDE